MKALLTATTIAAVALVAASAPSAAQNGSRKLSRDAAISQCTDEVAKQYPFGAPEAQAARTAAWKACMTKLGFRP